MLAADLLHLVVLRHQSWGKHWSITYAVETQFNSIKYLWLRNHLLHRCFHFFASTTHCFCFKISVPSKIFKPLAGGLHFPSPCFPRQNSAGFPENWSRSVHGLLGLSCLYLWKLTDRRVLRDLWERKARPEENDGKRSGGGKIIETYWNTVFRRYSCLPGYLGLTPKVWQFHSNNYQKPEDLGVPIFRHFQTKPYVFIDFCHFYIGSCFAKLVHCLFFFESHNSNIL